MTDMPPRETVQAAMARFARAYTMLGDLADRGPADEALCEAIHAYARGYAAQVTDELAALRKFAQAVMQSWPDGDVDGGELQDAAVSAGLLAGWHVIKSCGEGCQCEYFPAICYRHTPLLTGEKT